MSYYTTAFRSAKRIKPSDQCFAVGVHAGPEVSSPQVGIAYPYGYVGGFRPDTPLDCFDYDPPEVLWRLEIDRRVVDGQVIKLDRKETAEGRYVLRLGEFINLGDAAE